MIIRVHNDLDDVFEDILSRHKITNSVTKISNGATEYYCPYMNEKVKVYAVHDPIAQDKILNDITKLKSYKHLGDNPIAYSEHYI